MQNKKPARTTEVCTLRLRSEYMNQVRKHARNEERKLSEMTNLIIKIGLAQYRKMSKEYA